MEIAEESVSYLRPGLAHPLVREVRASLRPLLDHPPAVTLAVAWNQTRGCWVSTIITPGRFSLGRVVATPGALQALAEAGQDPREFLARHQAGDWGEVPEEDTQENEYSLEHGFRLLSAYTLQTGVRLWLITEADRSATTILEPEDY